MNENMHKEEDTANHPEIPASLSAAIWNLLKVVVKALFWVIGLWLLFLGYIKAFFWAIPGVLFNLAAVAIRASNVATALLVLFGLASAIRGCFWVFRDFGKGW